MKRWWLALVGVGAIAVAIAWRCHGGTESSRTRAPERVETVTSARPTTPRGGGSIAGNVRDEHGTAIAGARVCAAELWSVPACTAADVHGAYAIAGLSTAPIEVTATAPQHRPGVYRPDGDRHASRFALAEGEHRTGVDIVLRGGAVELHVVVSDVTGGPVAHAIVRAGTEDHDINERGHWDAGAEANDKGEVTLWVASGDVRLHASADGYASIEADGFAPGRLEILLTPESSLSGTVVDASGAPVAGAEVSADHVDTHEHARTDEQGRFHVGHLLPERYDVSARSSNGFGRTAGSVAVGLASHVDGIVIKLHPAYRVSGRVVVGDKPCPHAEAKLYDGEHDRTELLERGADDTLHADGIRPGTYLVHVKCPRYRPVSRLAPVVIEDRDQLGILWPMTAGARLHGTVRSAKGEPVAGALVNATSPAGWGEDRSGADGSYEIGGLAAGDYEVIASTDGSESRKEKRTLTASGDAKLDLALVDGALIGGQVVDTEGHGVADVEVHADGDGREGGVINSGPDGTFALQLSQAGSFVVSATADWQHAMTGPHVKETVTLAPGETATVKLVIDALSAQITGDVRTVDGKPIADAYVVAYPGGDFLSVWRWTWSERPVLTATDGTFAIKRLAPGSYTVHAYRKGGGETVVPHVATGTALHLQIAPTAMLAGTVTFADGTHPEIVSIWVRQEAIGFARIDQFENTSGAFTITDVPAGELEVVAKAPDGLGKISLPVAAGEHKAGVTLPMERLVPVTGRLVDGSGHPMPDFVVLARNKRISTGVVVSSDVPNASGDDGRFTTLALPGDVTIAVANPDMMDHTWCLPQMQKTITAPLDLGDIVIKKAPCP